MSLKGKIISVSYNACVGLICFGGIYSLVTPDPRHFEQKGESPQQWAESVEKLTETLLALEPRQKTPPKLKTFRSVFPGKLRPGPHQSRQALLTFRR
jgi:hypothetical protein